MVKRRRVIAEDIKEQVKRMKAEMEEEARKRKEDEDEEEEG